MNQRARELLDGNALDAVFLGNAAGFLPPCSSGLPLILDAFLHVREAVKIRPRNGGYEPVRGLIARCACRQTGHGNNGVNTQLASQNHGITHGLGVLMTHRGVNQRVAGAVQRGNFQTAALDFLQKCFALCVIVDVLLSGRDKVAAAPAAGSQLNSVQTVSYDLVQHLSQRNLSEYIGANRKFHVYILQILRSYRGCCPDSECVNLTLRLPKQRPYLRTLRRHQST